MNKNIFITKNILFLAIILMLSSFFISCSSKANEPNVKKNKSNAESVSAEQPKVIAILNSGKDVENWKRMNEMESFQKIDAWGAMLNEAENYEKIKQYNKAEEAYKAAIKLDPEHQGVARYGLADIYEATGQYQLALEQIEWLMEGQTRQDVLAELQARKQKLEQLLKEHSTSI